MSSYQGQAHPNFNQGHPYQQQEDAPPPAGFNIRQLQQQQQRNYTNEPTAPPTLQNVVVKDVSDDDRFDTKIQLDKRYNADCTLILFICLIPVGGFIIIMSVSLILRNML